MSCLYPQNAPSTGYKRGCRCERCGGYMKAANARAKERYRGVCERCGGHTSGCNGRARAPKICAVCLEWPEEAVIAAIRAWAACHDGVPPTMEDWRLAGPDHPSAHAVTDRSRGRRRWNDLLLAAGFRLATDRYPETQATVERMIREGSTCRQVAEHFGWSTRNVEARLYSRGLTVGSLRAEAGKVAACPSVSAVGGHGWVPSGTEDIKECPVCLGTGEKP